MTVRAYTLKYKQVRIAGGLAWNRAITTELGKFRQLLINLGIATTVHVATEEEHRKYFPWRSIHSAIYMVHLSDEEAVMVQLGTQLQLIAESRSRFGVPDLYIQ